MQNLKQLELPQLMDLLTLYTSNYTRMFLDKQRGNEFEECKFNIDMLQREINLRVASAGSAAITVTDADIKFDRSQQTVTDPKN